MSKNGDFSGAYFSVFGLNMEIYHESLYSLRMRENKDQKNLPIWTLFTQW